MLPLQLSPLFSVDLNNCLGHINTLLTSLVWSFCEYALITRGAGRGTNIECVGTASTTPPIPAWYLTAAAWQHTLLRRPNNFELQLLQPHWRARKKGVWSIFSYQKLRLFQIHDGRLYVPSQRESLQKCGRNHVISWDTLFLCKAYTCMLQFWRLTSIGSQLQ